MRGTPDTFQRTKILQSLFSDQTDQPKSVTNSDNVAKTAGQDDPGPPPPARITTKYRATDERDRAWQKRPADDVKNAHDEAGEGGRGVAKTPAPSGRLALGGSSQRQRVSPGSEGSEAHIRLQPGVQLAPRRAPRTHSFEASRAHLGGPAGWGKWRRHC